MTTAPCPIVHSEDFHITGSLGGDGLIHCPQNRIGAGLKPQPPGQATTSFATQGIADREQGLAIPAGLSTIGPCHRRQSLCKDPAATISRPAVETMRPQADPNRC